LLVLPLYSSRKLTGMVLFHHEKEKVYHGMDLLPLQMIGRFIINKRESEIRAIVREEENRKIARDLHDGVAQNLAVCKIITDKLLDTGSLPDNVIEDVERLKSILQESMSEVCSLFQSLHLLAASRGMKDLLNDFCRKFGNQYDLDIRMNLFLILFLPYLLLLESS